ncbi:MAG: iron-sulfur cluster assembly scaffold protein [Candidatus Omnitrophica bacterium]|nr:iron-sulfur cluster assembly scaffold protein [Candidatus Omnitrophota bacterium]
MEDNLNSYPKELQVLVKHPQYFGRMNAPDGAAVLKGLCGDEMEFYLDIEDRIIQDVKFFTNGCEATIACGEIAARLAKGRSIDSALGISPKQVKDILKALPAEHSHCPILAISTLYRAIADYLLKV